MKDQLLVASEEDRDEDRREAQEAVPEDLARFLNEEQLAAVENIERFGCTLKFVRRPVFQTTVPVLEGPDGETMGIVEENGHILWDPNIDLRK